MNTVVQSYLNDRSKENMARLTLIQLFKTGNHIAKKKKKGNGEQFGYHQVSEYQDFDLGTSLSSKSVAVRRSTEKSYSATPKRAHSKV